VATGDEARRRIERDLHDGTQQRLVSLALAVRAAAAELPAQSRDVQAKFSRIASGLGAAVDELQELSRGIHPAILSDAGLGPALEALALRSPIPVDLKVRTQARFPEPVEVAAYFVASKSLANAAKHSRSTRIDVVLAATDETLLLSVRDDGAGGADPRRGSGLVRAPRSRGGRRWLAGHHPVIEVHRLSGACAPTPPAARTPGGYSRSRATHCRETPAARAIAERDSPARAASMMRWRSVSLAWSTAFSRVLSVSAALRTRSRWSGITRAGFATDTAVPT
jgi:hypothetical protein